MCQAAIFPAQPVAAPYETPRAGVIVRVPAEGMVAQSPFQGLLCCHVPVGGLRGPWLALCVRDGGPGSPAVTEPSTVVAARANVWGERRLAAASRWCGFPPPSYPLCPFSLIPLRKPFLGGGWASASPKTLTHPHRKCVRHSPQGNGIGGGHLPLGSGPR